MRFIVIKNKDMLFNYKIYIGRPFLKDIHVINYFINDQIYNIREK